MNRIMRTLMAAAIAIAVAMPMAAAEKAGLVDLNTASVEELVKLPRVGPSIAQRVVEYRTQTGGFRKVEELMNVRGIGQKTFELLKDKITISEPSSPGKGR